MSGAIVCEADFNYVDLASIQYEQPKPVRMTVKNGRDFDNPGWEVSGFELKNFPSAVEDWNDPTSILEVHYAEVAAFAKALTGCDHALVGSHILRNPEQEAIHQDLGPIQFVHSDFAASYGDRMREYYASESDEAVLSLKNEGISANDVVAASRMVILQFWRNVGPTKMDLPIAFCDARTVPAEEVVAAPVQDYAGGGFDFETLAVLVPKKGNHEWYNFPDMSIDEAVAFRTYDSDRVGTSKPFWTPHSAYRDPEVESGSPSRYSIELRATCLFT